MFFFGYLQIVIMYTDCLRWLFESSIWRFYIWFATFIQLLDNWFELNPRASCIYFEYKMETQIYSSLGLALQIVLAKL